MDFISRYGKRCYFCGKRRGLQPDGGHVILVRRKVAGKEVLVCKSCLLTSRRFIK